MIEHPQACIQCGICVEVCPVEKVGGHAIVTFLANPKATNYSVWLCSSCWRCHQACPVGVDIYGLMMEQRCREQAPAGYQAALERVLTTGLALEVELETLDQMRAAWGLEPVRLPPHDIVGMLLGLDEGEA